MRGVADVAIAGLLLVMCVSLEGAERQRPASVLITTQDLPMPMVGSEGSQGEGAMQEGFRRDYLVRSPLPLAQLYDRAYNEGDVRSQHEKAFYLCEYSLNLWP